MTIGLIDAAIADLNNLRKKLEVLRTNFKNDGTSKTALKKTNGRLTEAGVRALRNMIDSAQPDAEIARELGVTQPAVYNHRQRYMAEKFAPKRGRQA